MYYYLNALILEFSPIKKFDEADERLIKIYHYMDRFDEYNTLSHIRMVLDYNEDDITYYSLMGYNVRKVTKMPEDNCYGEYLYHDGTRYVRNIDRRFLTKSHQRLYEYDD